MHKILTAIVLAATTAGAHAADWAQQTMSALEDCYQRPRSNCWRPAADLLEQQTDMKTDLKGFDFLSLSLLARRAGDFSDAYRLLARAKEELARAAATMPVAGTDGTNNFELIFKYLAAQIQLAGRDYEGALINLQHAAVGDFGNADMVLLSRAAALIGLGRDSEAEPILRSLQKKLPLDSGRGFCATGILPGMDELNPYDVGRRIAAFYFRTGKAQEALSMLQVLEQARVKNLRTGDDPSQPWAALIDPKSLLEDQAIVLHAMGNQSVAMPRPDKQEIALDQLAATLPLLH